MITDEDKLVYKKYQIAWHELPSGVRKNIYRDYPLGDLSKMLTECELPRPIGRGFLIH